MIKLVVLALLMLSAGAPDNAAADETAERHVIVARYYVGRGDYVASISRFTTVVTKFQSSEYVEEALAGLTEAYLRSGMASQAQATAAILIRKFPDGVWAERTRVILKSAGLEPADNPSRWIHPALQ